MEKVIVFGASGHAKVIIEAIELAGKYEIFGCIDSYKRQGHKILNYEVLGNENLLKELYTNGINKGIIAIGDNWTRHLMKERILKIIPDFEFITVIHPKAIVSEYSKIGKGTVILSSAEINVDAEVGEFCIVNINANLGHDSIMKNFSSLAPSATTGGEVTIDEFTAISIGVNIIQNFG